jgi:hydrogenase maturation protease
MAVPRVLIIGFGNTLRGDDAIGVIVAERLASFADGHEVVVLSQPVLTPELAMDVGSATLVIFLDAALSGPDGVIVCEPISYQSRQPSPSLHELGPVQLLVLTKELCGTAPDAILVSVKGQSFELADRSLSPGVFAAVEPMVEKVRELTERHRELLRRD